MSNKKKNETEEKKAPTINDEVGSFLKQNKEYHYNFEDSVEYKISSGSLYLDTQMSGGLNAGLHRFCGINEGGKEQPVSERVLTPTGWRRIGDLEVGDKLIDPEGGVQSVVGVYPQGIKDVYTVVFSDGTKARCGIEHLWPVYVGRSNEIQVMPLSTMIEELPAGLAIPRFMGADNNSSDSDSVNGYIYGTIFGALYDADTCGFGYSDHEPSDEMVAGINEIAEAWAIDEEVLSKGVINSVIIKASREQRAAFLEGFLYGLGVEVEYGSTFTYLPPIKSPERNSILELIKSLGFEVSIGDGEDDDECIGINLEERVDTPLTIKTIIKEGYQEESVCIAVSHPLRLYITSGMNLTHNTSCALSFMYNFLDKPDGFRRRAVYFKAEGRLSKEMMERSGVNYVFDIEDWEDGTCFVFESNVYETVIDFMRLLVQSNKEKIQYFFLLDSVDGLIPKGDLDRPSDESNKVAGGAVIAGTFMKKMSIALAKRGHCAVFISQVRADVKIDPYSKVPIRQTTATGGNALLHFANWILEFEPRFKQDLILQNAGIKEIDIKKNPPVGHFAKVTVKKSPNEKTNLRIEYPIRYGRTGGKSVWVEKECVDLLLMWELITKSGSWYAFDKDLIKEASELGITIPEKVQGLDAVFTTIENDEKLCEFLVKHFKKFF